MRPLGAFQVGAERQRQLPQLSIRTEPVVLRGEEAHIALYQRDRSARLVEYHAIGADIACTGLEQRARVCQRLAAFPQLDNARVTRGGHRARPEVGADEHRIFIEPGDRGLGFFQPEACRDEAAGREIELPHHHRIAATP